MLTRPFLITLAAVLVMSASTAMAQYSITVLHNNDGESNLDQAAEFATLINTTRTFYQGEGHGVVSVYAGDSFIPSPEFQASLDSGPLGGRTYYDALALNAMGYDAAAVGNHEFDAGPDVFADYLDAVSFPYLSANLNVPGSEALLNAQLGTKLKASHVVTVPTAAGNKTVGIIGATTTNLPFITTTGDVTVGAVAAAVNAEVADLKNNQNVDHVIVVSHLQGISEDLSLVPSLSNDIDLIIAGGGDEILADLGKTSPQTEYGGGAPQSVADTGLLPGDSADQTDYPNTSTAIPVVTSGPEYGYLGRVTLDFDNAGVFQGIDSSSNPQINSGFAEDVNVKNTVETPVSNFKAGLAATQLATSSELLRGNGDRDVIRAKEAGLGNLIADAFLKAAVDNAAANNADVPAFALVNGGGIRDDIAVGAISRLTTFDVSPFGNVVTIVEDVKHSDLALLFENAYSRTTDADPTGGIDVVRENIGGTGRFTHVSEGVEIVYDLDEQPMRLDGDGNITQAGNRMVSIKINGLVIMEDGIVLNPSDTIDLATVNFLALGVGDQLFNSNYLSMDYSLQSKTIGITDQQAAQSYLEMLVSMAGATPQTFDLISDSRYDNTRDGRIVEVPEPGSFALLTLAGLALLRRRR